MILYTDRLFINNETRLQNAYAIRESAYYSLTNASRHTLLLER